VSVTIAIIGVKAYFMIDGVVLKKEKQFYGKTMNEY